MPEMLGIDAALCFSVPAAGTAEGVCAMAGIAAIVAMATKRRKSRCVCIGRLLSMNVSSRDLAGHFSVSVFAR
jgi:hypothetical protein